MLHRVLDEWLQREDRYNRLEHIGIHLDTHRQTIAKSSLLQAKVLLHVM